MPSVTSLESFHKAITEFVVADLGLVIESSALAIVQRSLDCSGLLLLGEIHGVREIRVNYGSGCFYNLKPCRFGPGARQGQPGKPELLNELPDHQGILPDAVDFAEQQQARAIQRSLDDGQR